MSAEEITQAGDRLKEVIRSAVMALMNGDEEAVWQILDVDAYDAIREWDRLQGRPVPSDEELERGRQQLLALLRSSLPKS